MRPYYTTDEVAKELGISERRVRKYCQEGRIQYVDRGPRGSWLILKNYWLDRKPNGRPRKDQSTSPKK